MNGHQIPLMVVYYSESVGPEHSEEVFGLEYSVEVFLWLDFYGSNNAEKPLSAPVDCQRDEFVI